MWQLWRGLDGILLGRNPPVGAVEDEGGCGKAEVYASDPGRDPFTLDAIGAQYSVTRERIRQIEKKAMEAMETRARLLELDQLL